MPRTKFLFFSYGFKDNLANVLFQRKCFNQICYVCKTLSVLKIKMSEARTDSDKTGSTLKTSFFASKRPLLLEMNAF